ncbi:hypothetical protein [Phaeobacter sp. B1627]|uniref:hypothetical protein n=1 Tax=Phaeobacter sp. B1627 TaxID=2583809 RepID=UPI00111940C6|nr:hypothetical protein [Phaeobacter sp. B1627]TNJ42735.1 hypothetical protein FGE21_10560 [Phaeobacter sp. B1627]
MLRSLKTKARRGARRVLFTGLCAASAAVGAGFASAALYAALQETGQTPAMAGLILAALWFGLSGLFLLLKSVTDAGADTAPNDEGYASHSAAEHASRVNGRSSNAPSMAEAFAAGVSEGAGFARSQQR